MRRSTIRPLPSFAAVADMSFILDALKKSESDRQRQSSPALFEVKVAAPRRRFPSWAIGLAVLLAINIAILTWNVTLDLLSQEATAPGAWTNEAAAGWGGDQWSLCGSADGRHVTLLGTLWDTPEDAAQFESALAPAAGRSVVRRRDAVVLVAGDAGDRAASLAAAALESLAPSSSTPTR